MDLAALAARLAALGPPPLLAGKVRDPEVRRALAGDAASLFPKPPADPVMAACALAGLHLWNDDWDACHNLCQGVATPTGSYWHGIAHRREGHRGEGLGANLGNARYWFRRTGAHSALPAIHAAALAVLDAAPGCRWATEAAGTLRTHGAWDPAALADWVGQAESGTLSAQTLALLERLQEAEMRVLLDWCLAHAAAEEGPTARQ